jgi:hypothetical protein
MNPTTTHTTLSPRMGCMHALSPACRWSSSFLIWQNEDDYFVIVIDCRRQRLATRHDGEGSCR